MCVVFRYEMILTGLLFVHDLESSLVDLHDVLGAVGEEGDLEGKFGGWKQIIPYLTFCSKNISLI